MSHESDSVAEWLVSFDLAIRAAKPELDQIFQQQIELGEIEWALDDILELDEHQDLMGMSFDKQKIVSLLRSYDFSRQRPQVLAKLSFPESILPDDVPKALYEEKIKYKGEVWLIHKNDADPFPSNPHAHNPVRGCKLDLSNGKLYLRRKLIGQVQPRMLLQFRQRVQHINLPMLAVDSKSDS